MSFHALNALYLRRRLSVLLEPGSGETSVERIATALKNLEALGYTAEPALIERMRSLDEASFVVFYAGLVDALREMRGAHVAWEPMYPNFPEQVMQASDVELYLNALLHYMGDLIGERILPHYQKDVRPALADSFDLSVIRLGDEAELQSIGAKLIGARTSISETDKADVRALVRHYEDRIECVLPTDIPHKENLTFTAALLLEHSRAADILLSRYFKTATDVLRLACALSEGDVSLAQATRFRTFSRPERRLLLALLERARGRVEDMVRWRRRWVRLGERLHPGERKHRELFPHTAAAFDTIRSGGSVETFRSRVEAALRDGNVTAALDLLVKRPGELARRLDHLMRLGGDPSRVTEAFAGVAGEVSTPVLLQIRAHFAHRGDGAELRAFFPKGNVAKVVTVPNTLPPIEAVHVERVVAICHAALVKRFSELEGLGKVYVDEGLQQHLVPFSQRSASKALRTLVRGSRVALPEGSTVRFFLWWKEGEVDGKRTGRVDIDLSSVMYDADWKYKEHISYTNLRSAKYRAAHSGDITSAPQGACEFIDIDIDSVVRYGGRYVVMNVLSFTRQAFSAMPECFAGWMIRSEPKSGEIFDPRTVVDRIDVTADTRIVIPVILDLVERCVIWADLGLSSNPGWNVNIESNSRGLVHMGKAITTLAKPNLYDLFQMHAEARAEARVDNPEDADTVFGLHQGTTPFDVETIMAEYL